MATEDRIFDDLLHRVEMLEAVESSDENSAVLRAGILRLRDVLYEQRARVRDLRREAQDMRSEATRARAEAAASRQASASAREERLAASEQVEQLQTALNTRIIIEQAKGMIAAQSGIAVDAAFEILRKHARDHNERLRDVARDVVHRGLRLP